MRHETSTSLRIQKARTSLILDHPSFRSLLFRLKGRECRSIQTMATDGMSLFYNPDFVETLNAATLAGTLAHEAMHPVLRHHVRRSGCDPNRWIRCLSAHLRIVRTRWKSTPGGCGE